MNRMPTALPFSRHVEVLYCAPQRIFRAPNADRSGRWRRADSGWPVAEDGLNVPPVVVVRSFSELD